jgi:hypothetical protein
MKYIVTVRKGSWEKYEIEASSSEEAAQRVLHENGAGEMIDNDISDPIVSDVARSED